MNNTMAVDSISYTPIQTNQNLSPAEKENPVEEIVNIDLSKNSKEVKTNSKKEKFLEEINNNLLTPKIKTHVISENGKNFLVISGAKNDVDIIERSSFDKLTLEKIEVRLGLKDNIIKKYNSQAEKWTNDTPLEKGFSVKIPLSEIGQKRHLSIEYGITDTFGLKKAVEEYEKD